MPNQEGGARQIPNGRALKGIIKKLKADDWVLVRVRRSHQLKHLDRLGLETVKHPDKDILMSTLRKSKGK